MQYVAQAIDKNTGYFGTCTWCNTKEDAQHYAKYYRSVGYKAKVFAKTDYKKASDENYVMRKQQIQMSKYMI